MFTEDAYMINQGIIYLPKQYMRNRLDLTLDLLYFRS